MNNADGVMAVGVEGSSDNFSSDCADAVGRAQSKNGHAAHSVSLSVGERASAPHTLLDKWNAMLAASTDPALSSGDTCVLFWIADYQNEKTGVAWPSLATLARVSGRSRRNVERSVSWLRDCGYINFQSGTRTTANRYRLTLKGGAGVLDRKRATASGGSVGVVPTGSDAATPGSDKGDGTVGVDVTAPVSRGTGTAVAYVPSPATDDVSYYPEHEARGSGPVASPPADAVGTAPADAGLPSASGLRYPEFWAHYPRREGCMRAESYLAELIAAGHDLAVIVDGARRYAALMRARRTADQYVRLPLNWLKDEPWMDPPRSDARPADQKVRSKASSEPANASTARAGGDGARASAVAPNDSPTMPNDDVDQEEEYAQRVAEALEPLPGEARAAFGHRIVEQAGTFATKLLAEAEDEDDREEAERVGAAAAALRKIQALFDEAGMGLPADHAEAVSRRGRQVGVAFLTTNLLEKMFRGASEVSFDLLGMNEEKVLMAVRAYLSTLVSPDRDERKSQGGGSAVGEASEPRAHASQGAPSSIAAAAPVPAWRRA